jgi:hypothetical protein
MRPQGIFEATFSKLSRDVVRAVLVIYENRFCWEMSEDEEIYHKMFGGSAVTTKVSWGQGPERIHDLRISGISIGYQSHRDTVKSRKTMMEKRGTREVI